jgi:acetyl esterase/lipase
MLNRRFALGLLALCAAAAAGAQEEEKHYDRVIDHVYLTEDGVDFYMDIFRPNGKPAKPAYQPGDGGRGKAILDVASGAWHSDRGKIRDHEQAQFYDILTARGYTVFAVRPGTRPKYTVFEMVRHIQHAMRYIKAHAADYGIDPAKIGISGASAGGHLTLLTVLNPREADPGAADPLLRHDTRAAAAGVFFPPTDFLSWTRGGAIDVDAVLNELLYKNDGVARDKAEIDAAARKASPIHLVEGQSALPPMIFFHGDADPIVPLAQSTTMVEKLREHGFEAELVVKPGGGHPWLTIPLEVLQLADWYDKQLAD